MKPLLLLLILLFFLVDVATAQLARIGALIDAGALTREPLFGDKRPNGPGKILTAIVVTYARGARSAKFKRIAP